MQILGHKETETETEREREGNGLEAVAAVTIFNDLLRLYARTKRKLPLI